MNDETLVEALLARVPEAGRVFPVRHDAFVRRTVLSASPVAGMFIDDLTHDVYVHLWRDEFRVLRQWERSHPLQAYLRTVTTRHVWDRLSRLQPVSERLDDDPYAHAGARSDLSSAPLTPEEDVVANERARIVRDALAHLGDTHSQILELRYVHDLSYNEIGAALGITSTNAGVRLNRALSRLRAALSPFVAPNDGLNFAITARM
jgi:RNA polymerase sigma factor (sigma-70 family)